MTRRLLKLIALLLAASCLPHAQAAIERLAAYQGPGAIDGELIGPGSAHGTQRLYLAYMYVNRTVDLVSVDPANGQWQVFENPAKSEYGAIMGLGPDGNVYLGTRPHAHLYRLNPHTGDYRDLGQPSPGEAYVYGLAIGSDRKLYGCTYPSAKLFRYDTASGKFQDLGRMDPKEQYGRTIAASSDGFVYVGIGTAQAHLVAYQISTGKHRDILPPSAAHLVDQAGDGSIATVHQGDDGNIYAVAGQHCFLVKDWTAREIPKTQLHAPRQETFLQDGRLVTVDGNSLVIHSPHGGKIQTIRYTYPGREGDVFRIGSGPDGRIYGSSILPFHLFTLDISTKRLKDLGALGHGEAYSLVPLGRKLYLGVYGGENKTPLMAFDPAQAFAPGHNPASNPFFITYNEADTGWRPEAMIAGPAHRFYIGSVAGYGSINGPLTVFDPRTHRVSKFSDVAPGESVVSLAAMNDLIVGGTSIFGGGGSHPTKSEATLFLWDPLHNSKIGEPVPLPGATSITDLLALPEGNVMGIAATGHGHTSGSSVLFLFDPHRRSLAYSVPFPFGQAIYNSVALGPDGAVWGLAHDGIFRFDPRTRRLQLQEKTPTPVTAGFALLNGSLYYASGPVLYRLLPAQNPAHP